MGPDRRRELRVRVENTRIGGRLGPRVELDPSARADLAGEVAQHGRSGVVVAGVREPVQQALAPGVVGMGEQWARALPVAARELEGARSALADALHTGATATVTDLNRVLRDHFDAFVVTPDPERPAVPIWK